MPARISVKVIKNLFPEVARKLPVATGRVVKATLDLGQRTIQQGMAASTPGPSVPGAMPAIDTGALIGSLKVEMDSQTSGTLSEGGADAPYAVYLEYGTSKMAARPHMTPASEVMARYFLDEMRDLESKLT